MFSAIKNWFKPFHRHHNENAHPTTPKPKIKPVGQGYRDVPPSNHRIPMPMVKLPKPSDRVMAKITTLSVSDDRLTFHYRGKHGKIVRVWVDSEDKRDRRVDFGDELSGDPLPHLSDLRDIAHVIEWELQQHGENDGA